MLSTGGICAYAGGGRGAGECVCGYGFLRDKSDSCSTGVLVADKFTGACRGARSGVCAGNCARMEDNCSLEMTPVSVRNSSSCHRYMLESLIIRLIILRTVLMVRRLRFERAMDASEEAILGGGRKNAQYGGAVKLYTLRGENCAKSKDKKSVGRESVRWIDGKEEVRKGSGVV